MSRNLIERCTKLELECQLLQEEHELTRCKNNEAAFCLKEQVEREAGREDAANDCKGSALYWNQQRKFAEYRVFELRAAIYNYNNYAA